MADLTGIIRLRRFQLDEKRQVLAGWHRFADELRADRARLEQSIAEEQLLARESPDPNTTLSFGAFVRAALDRRKRIDESLAKIEAQIEAATEEVREAFADLKRFEQTQAERRARENLKRARAETAQLDEIGLEGYRRRSDQPAHR
ncbi:MAG TPA: flagellar FliJ family protein [Alphaproteobacteria bacterium]|nr:flagellar FliJ family protein [Alphaproteobacteria bacterium]